MKRLKFNTLSLFLTIVLLGISLNTFSQDKKERRTERKEKRQAIELANFNKIDSLVKLRSFVIEADILQNNWGYRRNVSSSINFIRVNATRCVIQTGSDSRLGNNGVGGVTAEGDIATWEVTRNEKNMNYFVRFSVTTNIGSYDVTLNLSSDTRASATVSGLTPGSLTWGGHIVSLNKSRVFKGQDAI